MPVGTPTIARVTNRTADHRPRSGAGIRIGGAFGVFVAALTAAAVAYAVARGVGAGTTSAGVVAQLAMGVGILAFGLAIRARLPAHERRAVTARKAGMWVTIGIALGLALVARIVVGLIATIGQGIDPGLCEEYQKAAELDIPQLWHKLAFAFALVVLAPLGEELVFRGLLFRGLARVMPVVAAAIVSGVIFGAAHPQYWTAWPLLVGVSLFGIGAAFVYRRYGYPTSVLAHALFNGVVAVVLLLDIDTSDSIECPE